MKEKYYTPTIEELLTAFVNKDDIYGISCCDRGGVIRIDTNSDNMVDNVFRFLSINDWDSENGYDIDPENYLLKYLDREDIEETGFIYQKTEPGLNQDYFEFVADEYIMDYDYDSKWCSIEFDGVGDVTLFDGKIYNKSELKWVLKRIGIV